MTRKYQFIMGFVFFMALIALLFLLNINHTYHYIVSQLLFVQIILGLLFYPKYVLHFSITLSIVHIIHDTGYLETFPFEAYLQSFIQLSLLFLVIRVLKSRNYLGQRLETIIKASRVGTWEWDIKSDDISINKALAEMLGYKLSELKPMSYTDWNDLIHEDDLERVENEFLNVINDQKDDFDIEIRMKHKNGTYLWVYNCGQVTERNAAQEALVISGTYTNIDDKKRSKEKIEYYHRLMSYIIDHMNSGIAVHDKEMNYIYVSEQYKKQYNVSDDIIGKNHYDVFPDLPEKWKKVHQKCMKGEIISADRDPYIHANGDIDVTRWECRPWYDESGKIGGIIVYTEVINDMIEIEEALRTSKETLQRVMDAIPIGIALHTLEPDIKFEYMNDQFPRIYQTSKEKLANSDFWETVYPDPKMRKIYKNTVINNIKSGDLSRMKWVDVPIHRQGEESKYITAYATPMPGSDQYISTVIDSTKRKNLEKSLIEQAEELFIEKEKIQATLMAIGDAVISTDQDGRIIDFNDIAVKMTGYSKEDVVGKLFGDVIPLRNEDTGDLIECPVKKVFRTKQTVYLENHTILYTKDKEKIYIEDSAGPIKDSNGNILGVILVIRDVTKVKEKQREIEYLSLHDYLTGLYNRRYFTIELSKYNQPSFYPLGLMMIDVNGLKIINDAYGHQIGDQVLVQIANTSKDVIQKRGIVSRVGGDEFTVIFPKTKAAELESYKDKMIEAISKITVKNVSLSVSIGYAIKTDDTKDMAEIMREAENIMYRYKLIDGDSARNQTIQAIHKTLTDKFELERTHSERVAYISKKMGEALKIHRDDLRELEMSGLFHDIGKISIPDYVLYKPAKLTKDEFEIIKEHTRNGYMILRAAGEYSDLAENALYHHEHYDGGGYPEGLKGEEIPLQSRIICIADAFEAMTANRPYRKGMSYDYAKEELIRYKGSQFDPHLVDVFVREVYPQLHAQTLKDNE
jgi:diguanylate cyclase (GGDEF)-like protein/PAS domain S-box-containing protein